MTGAEPRAERPEGVPPGAVALFSSGTAGDVLRRVVALAVATIDGCDIAGICVVRGGELAPPASTSPLALVLDQLQVELGEGPCHDAVASGHTVVAADLAVDSRWPRFGPEAAAYGIRSALAFPLPGGPHVALHLYGEASAAFDEPAEAHGLVLARLAGVVLELDDAHTDAELRAANLEAALNSREVIGQAQGILMERGRLTADQAFERLRRASQHLNVKLRRVAQDLVETGEYPPLATAVASATIPPDESSRLAAVRRYDVLDTPPDGAFDRITALAARVCTAPVAIVSIVDVDRIWFKSHHGTDVEQLGRDAGLCASAILQDGPWIVEDATTDPRTLANPLVTGEFGLGFYLGVPLRTGDGYNLGTLCVLDHQPRQATGREIDDLTDLAGVVMDELELRLASRRTSLLAGELREQAEDLAVRLQESLLPPALPEIPGLELAARYVPAHRERVGGDFYDVFPTEGSYGLVVGDVCGHGPIAASLTSMARHTIRALGAGDWSPARSIELLNRAVLATPWALDHPFCTVALIRLDPGVHGVTATIALGGHPKPLLLRADGTVETLGDTALAVGWFADGTFRDVAVELAVGDTVVLYTDGLTDAGAGDRRFDEAALRAELPALAGSSADRLAEALIAAVGAVDAAPRDDIAVLVARLIP